MATALITGASAGIGETFAQVLAARSTNLVLVARSQDKLAQLAQTLQSRYQVQVDVITQDLTETNAATAVLNALSDRGLTVDLLVNNAGFGAYGAFAELDRQQQLNIIQLNILALVDLTHQILQSMRERRSGGIINLASTAAFQAMPYFSIYAATKAFVLSFSEALAEENREFGVRILAVCPGPTDTDFFEDAEFPSNLAGLADRAATPKEVVVQAALEALELNQTSIVPGQFYNQIFANLHRVLPRELLTKLVGQQLRRS